MDSSHDQKFKQRKASEGFNGTKPTNGHQKPKTIISVKISDVEPSNIEYIWKPTIPRARPVAIEGYPGVGKTALIMKIIAHATTGMAFPNLLDNEPPNPNFEPMTVCIFTSEDDVSDTIRPRLEVNRANCERVIHIPGWTNEDGEQGQITMRDIGLLKSVLNTHKPGMIIFDPFQAYFGPGTDMNKANETRPVLAAVDMLCREHNCTPIFVRHVGKSRREAINAGLGSIDISGIMRSIIYIGMDPNDENQRILAHSKSNGGRIARSLAYVMKSDQYTYQIDENTPAITIEAPLIKWNGFSNLSANDLSMPLAHDDQEERSMLMQAMDFLNDLLSAEPLPAKDVEAACKANGFSSPTVRRAKAKLGIKSKKLPAPSDDETKSGSWLWELPEQLPNVTDE